MRAAGQSGGTWVQLVAVLVVIGLLVFEGVAIAVANVTADDTAREVARAVRAEYRGGGDLDAASAIAEDIAAQRGTTFVSLEEDGDELVVTLSRPARTLVAHRIGALDDVTTATVTSRTSSAP